MIIWYQQNILLFVRKYYLAFKTLSKMYNGTTLRPLFFPFDSRCKSYIFLIINAFLIKKIADIQLICLRVDSSCVSDYNLG